MVLDIANTGVARGKIYLARQKGQTIPVGWAIDAEGAPTTDPLAAHRRHHPADGRHKGYGVAVMMDVLSGVLTGSALRARACTGPTRPSTRAAPGHLMIALDIAAFQPLAEFEARMAGSSPS